MLPLISRYRFWLVSEFLHDVPPRARAWTEKEEKSERTKPLLRTDGASWKKRSRSLAPSLFFGGVKWRHLPGCVKSTRDRCCTAGGLKLRDSSGGPEAAGRSPNLMISLVSTHFLVIGERVSTFRARFDGSAVPLPPTEPRPREFLPDHCARLTGCIFNKRVCILLLNNASLIVLLGQTIFGAW